MVNAAQKDFFSLFQKNDYVLTEFLFLQHLSFSLLQRPNVDKFKEGYLSQKKKGEYVIPFYIWPRIHLTNNFRYPANSSKCIGLGSQNKRKISRIPSLALGKKGNLSKVHELGPYFKKKYTSVPSSVLAQ